jgi:hypothetical protein
MGTWNAFYVRAESEKADPAIRKDFPKQEIEQFEEFVGVNMGDEAFEAPEAILAKLSAQLDTDVMWMSLQSTVDAFQFHHWKSGKQIRVLVYGCFKEERTWERAEGDPESWEREVFFDPKELEFTLEYVEDEDEQKELRRIWRDAEVLAGRTEPGLSAKSVAHKVARHYRFPHYGIA